MKYFSSVLITEYVLCVFCFTNCLHFHNFSCGDKMHNLAIVVCCISQIRCAVQFEISCQIRVLFSTFVGVNVQKLKFLCKSTSIEQWCLGMLTQIMDPQPTTNYRENKCYTVCASEWWSHMDTVVEVACILFLFSFDLLIVPKSSMSTFRY